MQTKSTTLLVRDGASHNMQDYADVMKMVQDPSYSKGDVYEQIMKKEENALNILNRVAEKDLQTKLASDNILDMSLLQVVAAFADTWKRIYQEALMEPRIERILQLLWTPKNRIHVGIMIALIAVVIYFVDISS